MMIVTNVVLCCNNNYQQNVDEKLTEQFFNKFILLWRKGFYPYEYMDNWRKLNETSLLEK